MSANAYRAIACLLWLVSSPWAVAQSSSDASQNMTQRIDELLDAQLHAIGWQAAGACSDAAFIRRAYLDLTGEPPSGGETLDFIQDEAENKRKRLVDRLLASQACASHFAGTWATWMLPDDAGQPFRGGVDGLQLWLRNRFAENLRYDRLVADLLVSSGPAQSGPTAFFIALEGKPEKIAAKTARVFMGVQLDCAECHDHPFDEWSQRDFWGFAAYFAQLSAGAEQVMQADGEVRDVGAGEVMLPGTDEVVPPKPLVQSSAGGLASGTRRQQLTLWLTTRENPFLARATVNRVWALLMGRGLIEPVDDMRSLEMASHPQLLSELSDYFVSTGYDLRDLVATIACTRAYGRATHHVSGPTPEASYAVMTTKPLTEVQLANSIAHIARQIADRDEAQQALLERQLGRLRGDASEAKLGMVSALVTLHGDLIDRMSRESSSRLLKALEAPHLGQHGQLRWLFLTVLNRLPTTDETAAFSAVLSEVDERTSSNDAQQPGDAGDSQQPRASWQSDLLWALVNCSEFAMTP